jgi:rod shape-determining protein MreB
LFGSTKNKNKRNKERQPKRSHSFFLSRWFGNDLAIDLGTANVVVYVKGRGIVVNEPAVMAVDANVHRVVAIGKKAQEMVGRTPKHICAFHPLHNGVIADYDATEYMLRYFIRKAVGKSYIFKPRVIICVPSGVTNVERRAVVEAVLQAGVRKVVVMEEPLAAAIGAGLDVAKSNGSMVVDIGGGTTDVAVLSLSGIVISESLKIGSNTFDEAIMRYLEKQKHIIIGRRTAEELKILIGTALPDGRDLTADVRGRSTETGLPIMVDVDSKEICTALQKTIHPILRAVVSILEKTPPELAADIADHGIVLTGGGFLLEGLDRLVSEATGMAAYLCDEPLLCVTLGAGKALNEMEHLKDSFDDL